MPGRSDNGRVSLSFELEGFNELEQKLARMVGHGLTNPELLAMYRSSALPMKRKMVQLSGPGRTGLLAKSISVRRAKKNRNDGARFVVGPRGGRMGAFHAHLVNLGTKGGMRKTRGNNKFAVPGGGEIIRTQAIEHPGTRPRLFVQKAFQQTADKVAKGMMKRFDKYIQKHLGA